MNTTFSRRIAAALAGPAVLAGVLGGALALGAPASAQPATYPSSCTIAKVQGVPQNNTSALTRAGQVNIEEGVPQNNTSVLTRAGQVTVSESHQSVTPNSCIGD